MLNVLTLISSLGNSFLIFTTAGVVFAGLAEEFMGLRGELLALVFSEDVFVDILTYFQIPVLLKIAEKYCTYTQRNVTRLTSTSLIELVYDNLNLCMTICTTVRTTTACNWAMQLNFTFISLLFE